MLNETFKNLNKTPVRTKSWLGVNDITLKNLTMPKINEFNNLKITGEDLSGVTIEKLRGGSVFPLNNKFTYGVGEELINQGEKEFNRGYLISINRKVNVEQPIIFEFNFNKDNRTLVDNFIIVAEEGARGTVIIKYSSDDNSQGYHNGVCKVYGNNNSEINVIKINLLNDEVLHFDSNLAEIQYGGKVNYTSIDLGGLYSITNFHGDLFGDTSEGNLSSIYLGDKDKVIDINYIMTHRGRRTNSEITTKGALMGKSKKTFRGTLDFKKGATRSVGAEEEYCMLLSPKAKSKAVPLLLCEEDDVSGQHAASAGKIDENKLFYLMSRGLSEGEARKLIVEASFNPIINRIPVERIKEEILNVIQRRLINES